MSELNKTSANISTQIDYTTPTPRFSVTNDNTLNDGLAYLMENGYVVISDIMNQDEITENKDLLWKFLENVGDGTIQRNDPDTWSNGWPSFSTHGVISGYGIGQSDFLWNVRSNRKVKKVFAQLWNDQQLLVSFDGCGIFRDWRYNPTWKTSGGWNHVDQNPKLKPDRCCIQGLVSLTDQNEKTGGLIVYPRTHLRFTELSDVTKNANDFVKVSDDHSIMNQGKTLGKLVHCRAGDLILWDSRTIHCNSPSIFLSFQQQLLMLERKMNNEMNNLLNYTQKWHQPVNTTKCEFVIYYTCVKPPKINLYFNSIPIKQVKQFQYLGYLLDHRLSFNNFIKQQINKMNNGLRILKYIHNKFPTFFKLKYRFFSAFIWPHFTFISTIYVLCSPGTQGKCHSFYRKCLRIIFRLPYTSNRDLHEYLKLPTLANRFHTIIQRRLYNIQHHESSLLNTIYQYHRLKSIFQQHYTKQKCIPNLLTGRPRQRIRQFYQNDKSTLFDKLLSFCNE
ncbi:unnamed protein product [Rotaria sp. Silwood2]|nr:unnamed protein product [Rotaria sp. Silwood2]